jgi:putative phosphoribosyl transferase
MAKFKDRKDAGHQLAEKLKAFGSLNGTVVLALVRGGVPVAFEVAKELNLPMDVFLVRKLGIPGHEETAMGALAMDDVCILDQDLIKALNISDESIDAVVKKELQELDRRNKEYRNGAPPPDVINRTVILIDDGLATGATMFAAIQALEKHHVERIIVAVPVAPKSACQLISEKVYKTVCLYTPDNFYAVGQWYEEFPQVSDKEVKEIIEQFKVLE